MSSSPTFTTTLALNSRFHSDGWVTAYFIDWIVCLLTTASQHILVSGLDSHQSCKKSFKKVFNYTLGPCESSDLCMFVCMGLLMNLYYSYESKTKGSKWEKNSILDLYLQQSITLTGYFVRYTCSTAILSLKGLFILCSSPQHKANLTCVKTILHCYENFFHLMYFFDCLELHVIHVILVIEIKLPLWLLASAFSPHPFISPSKSCFSWHENPVKQTVSSLVCT